MTNPNDANALLMGNGAPAVKFPTVGSTVTGTVLEEPTSRQQTNYRTGVVETWPDGSPKMQVLVQLATNLRDPEKHNDDGTRTLYIKGKELTNAVRQAVRQSGANGIHKGGQLTVQYYADGPTQPGLDDGPKLYAAQYIPPAVSFSGVTAPASAPVSPAPAMAMAAPQVQQPAPHIPAAVIQSVTPNAAASAMAVPANVDPNLWARLNPAQQQAVLAASGANGADTPPF